MNTPNPASVFGKRRIKDTHETSRKSNISEVKRDDETAQARRYDHELGNDELPIAEYREQIVDAVGASQVTIITAETGAGKSTQVPQMLAEQGYEVIMTQPRVVAARNISGRIREEIVAEKGEEYGSFVGYKTAREGDAAPDARILVVTDGLQQVRELSGNGVGKKQVLVLDEVHEWNENMEVLVAWAKKRMNEDPDFKVIAMSATMDTGPLAHYFADYKREVPVIGVPGRTFPVEMHDEIVKSSEMYKKVAQRAAEKANEGKSSLVFMPGKGEIEKVIDLLEEAKTDAIITPLHGQQDKAQQQAAFATYVTPKIVVTTNVAETSVTVPGIDAVIDTGLERRKEVRNGVEGLYLRPIAQANCKQRAGRAGRVKAGEYYRYNSTPMQNLEAYGTPEILRTRLDGMVLRLAKAGMDAAEMDFYNVESRGKEAKMKFAMEVRGAKWRLNKLGALTEDGEITKLGKQMERMPLESHYARMMIEARKFGYKVQRQLAAGLAAQEVGGVTYSGKGSERRWKKLITNDGLSDVLAQLEVFIAAQKMSQKEQRDHDIMSKNFSQANGVYRQLRHAEKLPDEDITVPTKEQREQLVRCVVAGMVDNVHTWNGRSYGNGRSARYLGNNSTVNQKEAEIVVGEPFAIETQKGTLPLLENVTKVPSMEMLRDVAPQLFTEERVGFITTAGSVVKEIRKQLFNGQDTGKQVLCETEESEERREYIVRKVTEEYRRSDALNAIRNGFDELRERCYELPYSPLTIEDIRQNIDAMIPLSVGTLDEARACVPPLSLDDIIPLEKQAEIMAAAPDEWCGFSLIYDDGQPKTNVDIKEMDVTTMSDEQLMLPDGRDIIAEHDHRNYYPRTLREIKRDQLEEKAEEVAAAAKEKIAQSVEAVADQLEMFLDSQEEYLGVDLKSKTINLLNSAEEEMYTDEWLRRANDTLAQLTTWRQDWKNGTVSNGMLAALMNRFNA